LQPASSIVWNKFCSFSLVDLRSAYSRCFFWGGKEGNIASFSLSSSCQCLREVRVIGSGSPALDRFDSLFAHVHGQRQLSVILGVLPWIGELKCEDGTDGLNIVLEWRKYGVV